MRLSEYVTNIARLLFGAQYRYIFCNKYSTPVLYTYVTNIHPINSENCSGNMSNIIFELRDVSEEYKEKVQRTIIERGWEVSRNPLTYFLVIDFCKFSGSKFIYIDLFGTANQNYKNYLHLY
ncbi:MAG: hypothetical protein C0180_06540, partial [Aciduliprofundum sp.]